MERFKPVKFGMREGRGLHPVDQHWHQDRVIDAELPMYCEPFVPPEWWKALKCLRAWLRLSITSLRDVPLRDSMTPDTWRSAPL